MATLKRRASRKAGARGPAGKRGPINQPVTSGPFVQWQNANGSLQAAVNYLGPEGPSGSAQNFDTKAIAELSIITEGVNAIRVSGIEAIGIKPSMFVRVDTEAEAGDDGFQSADGAWWMPAVLPESIIMLYDGQSNVDGVEWDYDWNPATNALRYNPDTGAFERLDPTKIRGGWYALHLLAKRHPLNPVYGIFNGTGSVKISNWTEGTPAPDMYAQGKARVEAALALIPGATHIGYHLRRLGESDALALTALFEIDWETVDARHLGEDWYRPSTQMIIGGVVPSAIPPDSRYDVMTSILRTIASKKPMRRRFVDFSDLTSEDYWDMETFSPHNSAIGYVETDTLMVNAALSGTGDGGGGSWPVYSSTVVPGSGSFTSAAALGTKHRDGNTMDWTLVAGIATVGGSATGSLTLQLPTEAKSFGVVGYGRTVPQNKFLIATAIGNSRSIEIRTLDGNGDLVNPTFADGMQFFLSGTYESE